VAWKRGGHAPDEDDEYAGFHIEFDEDVTELEFEENDPGDAPELVAGRPASRWSRVPLRYRVTAVASALVLIAGSVTAVQLVSAARRRASERFTLAVVNDHYQPFISQVGLDLALTLVNRGPAPVTVEFFEASQPGLLLDFYPVKVPMPVGKPYSFHLVGAFDCQDSTSAKANANANTVEVTVSSQTGISSVTLDLAPGTSAPEGWQVQRSEFCAAPGDSVLSVTPS
jgi:hypothetical protein